MKFNTDAADSPDFELINHWCRRTDMSRSAVYNEIGNGNLPAIKVGTRTLIDVAAGLAWLRSRPRANIRPPAPRQPAAAAVAPKVTELRRGSGHGARVGGDDGAAGRLAAGPASGGRSKLIAD